MMSGGGLTGGATNTADGDASTIEMTSPETGASLKRPVSVVRGGTREPALSETTVRSAVGGVNVTTSSVPVPVAESEKSHVWNGAVNGDTARASNKTEHSFVGTLLRPSGAFHIATSIYVSHLPCAMLATS
jgi:hypothetical protein